MEEKMMLKEEAVYSNMIDLLLEYGNKTEKEIIDDAIERFGFPEQELKNNVRQHLESKKNAGLVEQYMNDGRFHLLDIDFYSKSGRWKFISCLSAAHLDGNQHLRKLKHAFEERGFI